MHFGAHIEEIARRAKVTLISDEIEKISGFCHKYQLTSFSVRIERKIHLINDFFALMVLIGLFKKYKFDAVHSIMSKAGLLSMLAAFIVGIPVRIHTFTGQYWVNKVGLYRYLLMFMDRLTASCATNLIADSRSQIKLLVNSKVVNSNKISILGEGSIAGVDVEKFKYDPIRRKKVREELDISLDATVFIFLGRLNDDKGVSDLVNAYLSLPVIKKNYFLLLVGPNEGGSHDDLLVPNIMASNNIKCIEFTNEPEKFLSIADVICLPSYREGFGNVLIEAAAAKVPSVASKVCEETGALVHEVSGIVHEVGNIKQIAHSMSMLGEDMNYRNQLGSQAMLRVHANFNRAHVSDLFIKFYRNLGLV